jgi:hypothetical protein
MMGEWLCSPGQLMTKNPAVSDTGDFVIIVPAEGELEASRSHTMSPSSTDQRFKQSRKQVAIKDGQTLYSTILRQRDTTPADDIRI